MLRFIAAVVLLSVASAVELQLEYSLDGSTFARAGFLEGNVKDGSLVLTRDGWSHVEQEALKKAASSDGLFTLKVSDGDTSALTSIRASCLAVPGQINEQMQLSLDGQGRPVGLAYKVESPGCAAAPASPSGVAALPKSVTVPVVAPKLGPSLSETVEPNTVMGATIGFHPVGAGQASASSSGGYSGGVPTNRPLGVIPGGSGEQAAAAGGAVEGQVPPEEKTWWQRNWLFVMGGVMVVMNVMGNMARQAQQGQQGGAPGGAGAAAGGRR